MWILIAVWSWGALIYLFIENIRLHKRLSKLADIAAAWCEAQHE